MTAPSEEETPRAPRTKRRLFAVPLIAAALVAGTAVLTVQGGPAAARPASASAPLSAQASQAASPASADRSDSATRERQAGAFTRCMREHGVKEFPGITVKGNGQIQLKPGGHVNPVSEEYRSAVAACTSKLPKNSSLPQAPAAAVPKAPALGFTCTKECPAIPRSPRRPADF
ncbi:hypothetical protein ACH4OW_34610 [Streptomyces sp. NPDC017056]|uniref:hypothetical protein n=1 Tax=Streptomyces sp. NPDC017056 TaxID=3364973 RepID=UPI00379A661C